MVFAFVAYLPSADIYPGETPCKGIDCGCFRSKCWSRCGVAAPFGAEWCYTTRKDGYSQDYNYQSCSSDDQCTYARKCAGPCTL